MAQEIEFLKGKATWVKVTHPDDFGKWKMNLYPNEKSLEKINSWLEQGLKNKLRKDDDGYFMTFSRPFERVHTKTGRKMGMAPVLVLDKDGKPFSEAIGNGSDVTIKLEVYKYKPPLGAKQAIAARLAAIRIDNLIPFNPPKDFNEQEQATVAGLAEQPTQEEEERPF